MTPLTDQIYWDAQPTPVQKLRDLPANSNGSFDIMARESLAKDLAASGYVIDRAIMIEGWGAARSMEIRQAYGYTTFPNAFTALPLIKVSTDAADYPAFTPPPPPFQPSTSPIGQESSGQYSVNPLGAEKDGKLMFKDGDHYVQDGSTYIFHIFPGMFGAVRYWTKQ